MITSYEQLKAPEKIFTLSEVSQHNNEKDLWIVLGLFVYDLTKFANFHPAGRNVLIDYAGQDCTELFLQFHSESVLHKYHEKLCIGKVSDKQQNLPQILALSEDGKQFGEGIPYGDPSAFQGFKSPYYDQSHFELRNASRLFMQTEISPFSDEWDEKKKIPTERMAEIGEKGFLTLMCGFKWPKEYFPEIVVGGVTIKDKNYFHEAVVIEEAVKHASNGLIWGLGSVAIGLPPLYNNGSEELKKKYVEPVLRGQKIIALAVTEPWAGSDVAGIKTTAKLSEDGKFYIVNGMKKFITGGAYADVYTTAVRTDEDKYFGVSMLIIESNLPGVKRRQMNMQGVWGSGTGFIIFENVKVPVENLVGDEGCAFLYIMQNFNHERWSLIAECVSASRLMVEECMRYSHLRKTFGKRLIDQPVIRQKLANMIKEVESLQAQFELITYNFERMTEKTEKAMASAIGICKAHSTLVLENMVKEAMQIVGGVGYQRGSVAGKVERYYRDAKSLVLGGGSPEVMFDMSVRMAGGLMPKEKKPKL